MRFLLAALICCLCNILCLAAPGEPAKPALSIEELQGQIERIMKDTNTPGVSVAIVKRDGPEWVTALGKADVAQNRPATADTLFRIGSTSKAFVSFAILKLSNEGKLSLLDPVRKLAPEVWFENSWESESPVRVVDLLEHTTGWDDMHLREYAKDAPGMSLREALDYDHRSRISRWPPGTRMAYCNSGPAVAAYIVEKISGQRFEDYVAQNFFAPIGMKTATYWRPAANTTVTLYHPDGRTPYPYWNILYRPAGAINASARDMAAYLLFSLNHGTVGDTQVLPAALLDRAENPTRTWAAQRGLRAGYGLGNYWSVNDGFVYHGHNGGVNGGLTELAYLPEAGVGYFYSINAGNGSAFWRIGKAIRDYVTRRLPKPQPPPVVAWTDAAGYTGWYKPDSPRVQFLYFAERIAGLTRVSQQGDRISVRSLQGLQHYVSIGNGQFRRVREKEIDPVATALMFTPDGRQKYLQLGGGTVTLKRLPAWLVVIEIIGVVWAMLALLAVLAYAPFWLLGGLSRRRRRPAERALKSWPLIAVLSLMGTMAVFAVAADDIITKLGNRTGWSIAVFVGTLLFGASTIASAIALWRAPAEGVRDWVRWYSRLVIPALLVMALYFAWWRVIGWKPWM